MSVIINDNFSSIIRNQLQIDLKDDLVIQAWFERIITIRFLESRNIFNCPNNYTKEEILHKCYLENKMFPNIFCNNLELLKNNYPINFYSQEIIILLNDYITINTPIETIIYIQEEFKNHERLNNFTSTNRNSDVVVNKENITTVTQIFTPKWVAKYMIQTSIGSNEEYSLSTYSTQYKEIKILDPCLGAGHLIFEAFLCLLKKYDFENQSNKKEIIKYIYKNQLFGFDIDKIVITFAKFIFLVKAIELCPDYIEDEIILPNFKVIKEYNINSKYQEINDLKSYFDNASLIGSLINVPNINYQKLLLLDLNDEEKELVETSYLLSQKYDIVITNPPYMGRKVLPKELLKYLNSNFKYGKSELYTSFIEKCLSYLSDNGTLAMLTLHTWMFIKSFANLRKYIINNCHLSSLIHLGKNTFENLNAYNALASAFVINKKKKNKKSIFIKLDTYDDISKKEQEFFNLDNYYYIDSKEFLNYKDTPFLYWLTENEQNILKKSPKLASFCEIRQGLATGNNKEYVRMWYEVDSNEIGFNYDNTKSFHSSQKKYAPYNKGGDKTKWYTTSKTVIKFDEETFEKLKYVGNHLPSRNYYFKEGITWSLFGFNSFNVRYKEKGYVFDVSGSSLFVKEELTKYILAYLSSNVAFYFLSALAPTVNFQVGNIGSLPFILDYNKLDIINSIVEKLICDAKLLDSFDELSWNYQEHYLVKNYNYNISLLENIKQYQILYNDTYQSIIKNEELLNNIFNDIYRTSINTKSTTTSKIPTTKEIVKEMISYFIGVIFKRYHFKEYKHNLDTTCFITTKDLMIELNNVITNYLGKKVIEEIETTLNMNLLTYLDNYFGKEHINKYHNIPIYWYKKINDKMHIGYYHTIKELDINKTLSIKENYHNNKLVYKLK